MSEFTDIVYVFKERADDTEPNGVQLDIEGDLPEKKHRPSRSVRHTAALFSREGELKYTAELGFFANWDKTKLTLATWQQALNTVEAHHLQHGPMVMSRSIRASMLKQPSPGMGGMAFMLSCSFDDDDALNNPFDGMLV